MAKKSVATLQSGSKRLTKVVKMIKKEGSKSYSFVETIIDPKFVKDWIAGRPIVQEIIPSQTKIKEEVKKFKIENKIP